MLFDSFQKRSIARQTGLLGFAYNVSLNNTTGDCTFGLSGSQVISFTARSGKVYDPIGNFVSSYSLNQNFLISGQAKGGLLNYSIDDEAIGVGVPITSGFYDWMFVAPSNCAIDFAGNILGETAEYSITDTSKYEYPGALVTGIIVNNNPLRPFRLFDVSTPNSDSNPFTIVNFTTGDITGQGYIVLQSTETGINDYLVPLTAKTNFGELPIDFYISGDYTRPPLFYINITEQTPLVVAGSQVAVGVDFSYFPTGMQLAVSLDYVSGTTGIIYESQEVEGSLTSSMLSGAVTGLSVLQKEATGIITGSDSFGNLWSTTGTGYLTSEPVYATGVVSGIYTGTVYGTGDGYIGLYYAQDMDIFGYLTGLVTGQAVSGVLEYSFPISGKPQVSGYPSGIYSTLISGYKSSSATVYIGNNLYDGDSITINNITTVYQSYDAEAPFSFSSLGSLESLLNEYDLFGVTASQVYKTGAGFTILSGGQIVDKFVNAPAMSGVSGVYGFLELRGRVGGEVGNADFDTSSMAVDFASRAFDYESGIRVIEQSSGRLSDGYSLTGGADIHYNFTPNPSDRVFYGWVSGSISATGLVSGLGSGDATGIAEVGDRERAFTGIWSLSTGDIDYLTNGYLSSISGYADPSPPTFSGETNSFTLAVSYANDYLTDSTDVVRLTISGVNTNSGLQQLITGTPS